MLANASASDEGRKSEGHAAIRAQGESDAFGLTGASGERFAKIGGITAAFNGRNISGRVADILPSIKAHSGKRAWTQPQKVRAKPIGEIVPAFAARL